jgi:hypothetical protein
MRVIPPTSSPGVIMRADRSFEIFIGGDGGAGSWRKVGELESIEVSDNSRIIESAFNRSVGCCSKGNAGDGVQDRSLRA